MTEAMVATSSSGTLAPRQRFMLLRRLATHRSFQIGFAVVLLLALAAVFAPLLSGLDPSAMKVRARFKPPSQTYLFGTDMFGRDIFTRVLYGARVSLWVGLVVACVSGVLGAVIGILAAQFRALDALVMRLMDALMSFPAILLALGITAALGPRMESVIIALSVAYVPAGVRLVRASALVVRELDYVQAARIAGASQLRIMLRHILPNSLGPVIVAATIDVAAAIIAESTLSFLGLGVPPPLPSWGLMIAEAKDYMFFSPWVIVIPGVALFVLVLGINLLGDGLRDAFGTRSRT